MFRQLIQSFSGDLAALVPVNVPPPGLPAGPQSERNLRAILCMHPLPLSRDGTRVSRVRAHEGGPVQNLALPQQLFWNLGTWAPGLRGIDNQPSIRLPAFDFPVTAWDHLIYAYFIENTRAVEIFRRIVRELVQGERLSIGANPQAIVWARTAEELFFRDSSPFPIGNLIPQVRPDFNATRRNAYYRMFAMDLNHGAEDGRAYPYEKAEASNRDFVRLFEQVLLEIWAARVNRSNGIGANPTDPAAIAQHLAASGDVDDASRQAARCSAKSS